MRKLLIGIIAAIFVVMIAALATPFLIPADLYKARLAGIVKERTGRDLRIEGPMRFSILPSIGLVAERLSLSSPPGGFTTDFLQTERIVGGVRLAPLLRGAVEIDNLTLFGPKVAFEVDKEGRRNWVFRPPPKQTSAAPTPAAGRGGWSIAASTATISRGTLTYFDQRGGKRYEASDIDLTVAMPKPAGPVTAEGSAIWNGEKVTVNATLASPGMLRDGGTSPATLKIASSPLKLSFQGELTGGKARKAAGVIVLDAPAPARLPAWLGLRHAAWVGRFGLLSLKGRIETAGSKISLTDAEIAADSASATGQLALDHHGQPALSGQLDVNDLDLTRYLKPRAAASSDSSSTPVSTSAPTVPTGGDAASAARTEQPALRPTTPAPTAPSAEASASGGTSQAGAPPPAWSNARFDLAPLKRLDADLKLRVKSLRWGEFHLDRAVIGLHLAGGQLHLDVPEMTLYGGAGAGAVSVGAGGTAPALAARVDLHGLTVQPLFHDLMDVDQLTGSGDIGLVLEGKGLSPNELVASLTGNTTLRLANGAVGSAGLTELMQGIAGPLVSKRGLSKTLDFDTLTATGTIAEGVLRNNDLKLVSPKVSVTGEGSVDLTQRQVNYIAALKLTDATARIAITGPWDNPSYKVQSVTIVPGASRDRRKLRELLKPNR